MLHRLHREVAAAHAAVATGPHTWQAGLAFGIGGDAPALQRNAAAHGLGHKGLADGLEHHVGFEREGLAGFHQLAAAQCRGREAHTLHRAVFAQHLLGCGPVANGHAVRLRPLLLHGRCRHGLGAPAVDDGHFFRAQLARLHGGVHRRHAAANHHHAAAHGQGGEVGALAQLGNEVHRIAQAGGCGLGHAQRVHALQAQSQEHSVVRVQQAVERDIAAQLLAGTHLDAADGQQPFHFLLREVVGGLVAGQAIFIEAAELGARLEQHHVMPAHGQAMRTGQARRTGAHHGHAFAGGGCTPEQRSTGLGKEGVGGVALQRADLHGLVFVGVAHAGLLAQHLGGAHAGAHAAQGVGLQDGAGGAPVVVLRNAVDERGDVDARGAGRGAGGVVAVVAALGLDQRLRPGERRVGVAEVDGVVGQVQACGMNAAGTACGCVHQVSSERVRVGVWAPRGRASARRAALERQPVAPTNAAPA